VQGVAGWPSSAGSAQQHLGLCPLLGAEASLEIRPFGRCNSLLPSTMCVWGMEHAARPSSSPLLAPRAHMTQQSICAQAAARMCTNGHLTAAGWFAC
jgi:hypothetical protein